MAFNLIASSLTETNTQDALDLMVEQMGKNMTLIMVTAPLAFLLVLLLLWVKFFMGRAFAVLRLHGQKQTGSGFYFHLPYGHCF